MRVRVKEQQQATFNDPELRGRLMRALGQRTPDGAKLSTGRLLGAVASWLGLVFGLCYVVLPTALGVLGISPGLLTGLWFNLPAFGISALVALVSVALLNPAVITDTRLPRDPVLSSMAGGFLTWATVHTLAPGLQSLTSMSSVQLLSFSALNLVECALIGMMLASFTRSKLAAFSLSALWQLMVLGLAMTLLGSLPLFL